MGIKTLLNKIRNKLILNAIRTIQNESNIELVNMLRQTQPSYNTQFLQKVIDYELDVKKLGTEREQRKSIIRKLAGFNNFINFFEQNLIKIENEEILFKELLSKKKLIILVSHELDLTGAPIAIQYFAEALIDNGMCPLIISPHDGRLKNVLIEKSIPVAVIPDIYQSNFISDNSSVFDLVVVNTIVGSPLVSKLSGLDIPVLWWVHEAEISYHPDQLKTMPESLEGNISVYCGGSYAAKMLQKYRPLYNIKELLYTVPDFSKDISSSTQYTIEHRNGRKVFCCIGTIMARKGQDILCQAIEKLTIEEIENSLFYFVGNKVDSNIYQRIENIIAKYPDNIRYLEFLTPNELHSLYNQMDCLICPSRDDPMPIVVTDSLILSKTVICSENTGSASLLTKEKAGLIYHNNSSSELSKCIKEILNKDNSKYNENARIIYDKYFSKEIFNKEISKIYKQIATNNLLPTDGKVSVIIPTYNGLSDLQNLLPKLTHQKEIPDLEIIIVDSESKDKTVDFLEKNGAKVIKIKQEEFSHSYARNLGAKNATGKYLLFMTQDALPSSDYWIIKLLQPILKEKAIAVSCAETPKKDCDLLGKVCIYNHLKYMEFFDSDRITSKPSIITSDTIRKNSQLNDVSCLIRKDVFDLYQYRGNYAEDLDLGMRLINDNYHLALLSSVKVVHSHTRNTLYHLRRGIVDVINLKRILPNLQVISHNKEKTLNMVISSYLLSSIIFEQFNKNKPSQSFLEMKGNFETLYVESVKNLQNYGEKNLTEEFLTNYSVFDQDLKELIVKLNKMRKKITSFDFTVADEQCFFVLHSVYNYLIQNEEFDLTKSEHDFYECFIKYFGCSIGNVLAGYYIKNNSKKDEDLIQIIEAYMKGI